MQQETRRSDLQEAIATAPTEPDAFLLWASQRQREEGKFELSRGRVDRAKPGERNLETGTPTFIAEVLSLSTASTDFTEKLEEYTAIDTLQTYLICPQDEPRAWVWSRQSDGSWPMRATELAGRNDVIALGGLDAELAMAAIFRGVPDAPSP